MTLGDFTAFNTYLAILIFPVILFGFMSNVVAQATASYMRLSSVLKAPARQDPGTSRPSFAAISRSRMSVPLWRKSPPEGCFVFVKAGTSTAVIGPTAAGKTQLLYVLIGLIQSASGTVEYDGQPLADYRKEELHRQIGFVFQDSIIFNLTLAREHRVQHDLSRIRISKKRFAPPN